MPGWDVELCKLGKIAPKLMPIVAAALIAAACEPDDSRQSASNEDFTRFCATEAADGTVVRAPDSECKTTTHNGGGASTFFLWYLLATRHGGYAPGYGSAFDSGSKVTPAGGAIYDAPAPGKSMRSGATVRSAPASTTRGGFGSTGSSKSSAGPS
jgi:hypothetical protein